MLYMNGTMSKAEKNLRINTGKIWKLRAAIMELTEELAEGNFGNIYNARLIETITNMKEEIEALEARYEELTNECAKEAMMR